MARHRLVLKRVSEKQRIAWLTLNRPEKKNALSEALLAELLDGIRSIRDNRNIRCIVLKANGDTFSAGMDLYDLRDRYKTPERWNQAASRKIVQMLRGCPQITLASVQGYCLGGGLVLLNACDLAIAAEDAKIGMPEIIRGSYGSVATPTLFQSGLPMKTAFHIQLTGRNLSGAEAARVGLVSQAVPLKQLAATVNQLAREVASREPGALEHAKLAAYTSSDLPFDLALKADEFIGHRLRLYANPTGDVGGYLKSQKGGGDAGYVKPGTG
jgi:enoyl-CoA hydratase/carnithine racemase